MPEACSTQFLLELIDHNNGARSEQGFNLAMNSAACPAPYTGRFVPEHVYDECKDDPIKLGKKLKEQRVQDPKFYEKFDPRRISATTVMRDYSCKTRISVADTEVLAKAVLTTYPVHYVSFLNLFFRHVRYQDAGLPHTLRGRPGEADPSPEELNRISWSAYKSVRGKDGGEVDKTLLWDSSMDQVLSDVAKDGGAMTGRVTAQDVYDVKKGVSAHLAIYKEMRDKWCKGFATEEEHAVALLWYVQEQGRNMCDDLGLMAESKEPDESLVNVHVPTRFRHDGEVHTFVPSPDDNRSICDSNGVSTVEMFKTGVYPVGAWSGASDATTTFLKLHQTAPYMWGWGHCYNIIMNKNGNNVTAFNKHNSNFEITQPFTSETYVNKSKTFTPMDASKDKKYFDIDFERLYKGADDLRRYWNL